MPLGTNDLSTAAGADVERPAGGGPFPSVRTRLFQGVTWNVVSAVFTQGSTFLSNIIIANILGRSTYGEYGMVQSTLLTVSMIAQVATGITATKYVAEFRNTDKERTGRILGLCSIISLITGCISSLFLLFTSPWLSGTILNAPHLATGIKIASGFVFFSVINGYQAGGLAGLEAYSALARAGIVQGLLHVAICSLAAWLWGLEGAFGGLLLSAIVRWYIYHRALRLESGAQSITIRYQEPWRERDIIRRFAVPAAISGLTSMPALWLANTFLVSQKDGYAQMGLYSAANNLKAIIMFLPALLNNVGTSLLNNQKGLGNDVLYRRIFWTNFRITAAAVVLGAGLMFGAGSWLLALFGKDFPEGEPVLRLLTLSVLFEALALASYQVIQSKEKMWFSLFAVALPRDLLIASLSFLFAPLYGAFGLAMAHTIAWSVALLIIIAGVLRFGLHTRSRLPLAGTHE